MKRGDDTEAPRHRGLQSGLAWLEPVAAALARWRVPLGFLSAAAALLLAAPTWASWRAGLVVAVVGEALRVWAAGHLEKGREVTSSGPYRWTRHPLYLGSGVMAAGVAIAAHSVVVAVLTCAYMIATIASAIRIEESFLHQAFGDTYERYRQQTLAESGRRFSVGRAAHNREHRAVLGLAAGFALLALKVVLPI